MRNWSLYELDAADGRHGQVRGIPAGTSPPVTATRGDFNDFAQRLEQNGVEKGIQLGEQRGIEKGEREAPLKIACTMLQSGIDCNTVMTMTGLTEEELQRITH